MRADVRPWSSRPAHLICKEHAFPVLFLDELLDLLIGQVEAVIEIPEPELGVSGDFCLAYRQLRVIDR